MKYIKKLVGKKCYLAPLRIEDAARYTEWLNNLDVVMHMHLLPQQITLQNEKEFLEEACKGKDFVFGIIDTKKNELIGNCGLTQVDWVHRHAVYGIFIGNKQYWSKGYGEEATKLVLDYGFNILNLNNILLSVDENNRRGIRCYEKCGFKPIGARRNARTICGEKFNVILMDVLPEEAASLYIQAKYTKSKK